MNYSIHWPAKTSPS